ncbi:MAG: hypothetical protein PHV82_16990, partial [Victivallaceae bacterium]|nr:hypothetical protein [Victivallaceae bacterium]
MLTDINQEEQLLKTAQNDLNIARQLLPKIIKDARLDEEQQKILWNKVHIRQKELANRKRVLKAQKSRMNNLNPEKQFAIDYPVRVIRHSNTKGKIRIEDNESDP